MGDAASAARRVARRLGLPAPHLLRSGSRTVFGAGDEVVLRVGGSLDAARADRDWSDHLRHEGVRVPRVLDGAEVVDGWCVVPVERVHAEGTIDWAEVGALLRRVHTIEPLAGLPHCTASPHWQFGSLLDELLPLIERAAAAALRACARRHGDWTERARSRPAVLLHGDVHPGNVVPTTAGPVLIDWDLRCVGPASWDHAPLMTWEARWDGVPGTYERFAAGYGYSFRGDAVAEALAELRLLAATLLRIAAVRTTGRGADELAIRLEWWRDPTGGAQWTPQ